MSDTSSFREEDWRQELARARGAVRKTLHRYLNAGMTGSHIAVVLWPHDPPPQACAWLAAELEQLTKVPWLARARTLSEKSQGRPSHVVVEVR